MTAARIASLDLLRGLAALSVAIPHFLMTAQIAPAAAETISILGVEIFFVLSGYVLAPQIITYLIERPSVASLATFWFRRWMRTIPPYLVALVAASILARQLMTTDFLRYVFYLQNIAVQANTQDYFPIAWSLAVEEWFYLLFPLACLGLAPMLPAGRSRPWIIGTAFIVAVTIARTVAPATEHWGNDIRRVVAFRMDAIGYGFLLHLTLMRLRPQPRFAWCTLAAASVIALVLTWTLAKEGSDPLIEAAFPFYSAALGASAIAAFLTVDLQGRLARLGLFLGRVSYSVYLFHFIALTAISGLDAPWPLQLAAFLAITVLIATLMSVAIEAPILAARPRYSEPGQPTAHPSASRPAVPRP